MGEQMNLAIFWVDPKLLGPLSGNSPSEPLTDSNGKPSGGPVLYVRGDHHPGLFDRNTLEEQNGHINLIRPIHGGLPPLVGPVFKWGRPYPEDCLHHAIKPDHIRDGEIEACTGETRQVLHV